jgi:hypothetical protein
VATGSPIVLTERVILGQLFGEFILAGQPLCAIAHGPNI